MSSVVPTPGGLVTWSVPPAASMRSLSPTSPAPRAGVSPADPVVADRQPHDRGGCVEFYVHDGGLRVLGGVGQRFGHRVVRRDLDRPGQPPPAAQIQLDRHRGPAAQRLERRLQPLLGQDRRVDPAGDFPHPVKHARQPPGDARQLAPELAELGGDRRLHRPHLQH